MVNWALVGEQVVTGLSIGSRLFLIAVGLSLIFGVMGVLNFTHGVLYMIGAYASLWVVGEVTVTLPFVGTLAMASNFWLGLLVAGLFVGIVGVVLEVVFIRRIYDREELDQLLLTFGFVLILTDLIRLLFGASSHTVAPPAILRGELQLFAGLGIPTYRAFVVLLSFVVLGALFAVLQLTNIGRLVRATSSDRDMASLLGVDVPLLYTGVFFAGCFLAGIGGAATTPVQSITPTLGNSVIINAFVVVVIGGLGSFFGAFVGAYLIGVIIAVGSLFVAGAGQLFPFVVLIAVLLVKPEGLFGGETA